MKTCWRILALLTLTVCLLWVPSLTHEEHVLSLARSELSQFKHSVNQAIFYDVLGLHESLRRARVDAILPNGKTSSVPYRAATGDKLVRGAYARVQTKPYFRCLYALGDLAWIRACLWLLNALILLPIGVALWLDALVMREVRFARFKAERAMVFRSALALTEMLLWLSLLSWLIPLSWPFTLSQLSLYLLFFTSATALRHLTRH